LSLTQEHTLSCETFGTSTRPVKLIKHLAAVIQRPTSLYNCALSLEPALSHPVLSLLIAFHQSQKPRWTLIFYKCVPGQKIWKNSFDHPTPSCPPLHIWIWQHWSTRGHQV